MSHPDEPQRISPSASERFYGKLLSACPQGFREEHGQQMLQAFGDLYREERHKGRLGFARLWIKTLPDLAFTAIAERSEMMGRAAARFGQLITLGNLMVLNGLVLLLFGLAFATVTELVELYGAELTWNVNDSSRGYTIFGFARLFGFLCMGYGLLLLVTSRAPEVGARKAVSGTLASINTFAAVYLLGTQIEIWQTLFGWITIAAFTFFALGYGFFWTTSAGLSSASSPYRHVR